MDLESEINDDDDDESPYIYRAFRSSLGYFTNFVLLKIKLLDVIK